MMNVEDFRRFIDGFVKGLCSMYTDGDWDLDLGYCSCLNILGEKFVMLCDGLLC